MAGYSGIISNYRCCGFG